MQSESASVEGQLPDLEKGVIVVGSVTADVTSFSSRLPAPGETLLGEALTLVLGGKGANQAIAAAFAGVRSHMVSCVGNDLFKNLVLDGLDAAGVDISQMRILANDATGVAHIRVDGAGENNIVIVPRANSKLDSTHITKSIQLLAPTSAVLLTQLEIPREIAVRAIEEAGKAGLIVVLDPAPALALEEGVWSHVDYVTPNESEATAITGIKVSDDESAITAGQWFCSRGVKNAVITLASAGVVLVSSSRTKKFKAFKVEVADTTAAGDAFAGYLGAALAKGYNQDDAIRQAMAAGALAVTRRGASSSLPKRADVERLLAAQPHP
ncbi:MAG: ribokinase [Rhodanobacter sp.]|nr:MAG: ribokinase [Rhodanobacter sp.]TAM42891.1 MAG: ribokinase [Rhodanobacter sp.]